MKGGSQELFDTLSHLPGWLLSLPIGGLELPLRIFNPLRNARISTVSDLRVCSVTRLSEIRNLGPSGFAELCSCLRRASKMRHVLAPSNAPETSDDESNAVASETLAVDDADETQLDGNVPLLEHLRLSLEALNPADAEVFRCRFGFYGSALTLEEIGAKLGVTRERARQRESRALSTLHRRPWVRVLRRRVKHLLERRSEPLYVDLIGVEDNWFAGFEDAEGYLAGVIETFAAGGVWVWPLRGRRIVARAPEGEWDKLRASARTVLQQDSERKLTRSDVDLLLDSLASKAKLPELSAVLSSSRALGIQYATSAPSDGDVVLAVGSSLSSLVEAVLQKSALPLELDEIIRQTRLRSTRRYSEASFRNALGQIGAGPFGAGRYGLVHHLGLDSRQTQNVVAELEVMGAELEAGRQWHSAELLAELMRRRQDLPELLNSQSVDLLLKRCKTYQHLRRSIWIVRGSGPARPERRRSITDLCIAILERSGRPMSGPELRSAVTRVRGVGKHFVLAPSPRIIRVGRGLWGLVERDLGLGERARAGLLDDIERLLQSDGGTLHRDAIIQALRKSHVRLPPKLQARHITDLARCDRRFRLTRQGGLRLES